MNALRAVFHLMRADFLERTRSYRFVVTLLVIVCFTYFFVPALDAPLYGTLYMKYRGVYSSAWIGTLATLLMGEYLLIFGFYLVKGPIARDQRTGVGEIIASTPIRRPTYTLGKWLSHVAFFTTELGVILLTLLILQYLRAEDLQLDLWGLASPLLILLVPALAVVAALATLFESVNWLRGIAGNLIYLFLVYPAIALPTGMSGAALLWPSVYRSCSAHFPDCSQQFLTDVSNVPLNSVPAFSYSGMHWTADILLVRLGFMVAAAGIALLAAVFFHRFDPARIRSTWLDRLFSAVRQAAIGFVSQRASTVEPESPVQAISVEPVRLTPLSSTISRRGVLLLYGQLLAAEWKLAFSDARWWWYLVALGLIAGSLFAPLQIAHLVVLPVAWIWPLNVWSAMGTREARHRTESLVLSGHHPLRRQLVALWGVGVLVALIMAAGVMLRLALSGAWVTLAALIIGATFVPSLALAMGCWSGTNRLFEAVYLFFWYLVAIQDIPYLDFMGRIPDMIRMGIPWIYAGVVIVLSGTALLGRRRQMIH
jgi:hypothetical protein